MTTTTLAAESSAGNPILNISIFAIFLIAVSYTHLTLPTN